MSQLFSEFLRPSLGFGLARFTCCCTHVYEKLKTKRYAKTKPGRNTLRKDFPAAYPYLRLLSESTSALRGSIKKQQPEKDLHDDSLDNVLLTVTSFGIFWNESSICSALRISIPSWIRNEKGTNGRPELHDPPPSPGASSVCPPRESGLILPAYPPAADWIYLRLDRDLDCLRSHQPAVVRVWWETWSEAVFDGNSKNGNDPTGFSSTFECRLYYKAAFALQVLGNHVSQESFLISTRCQGRFPKGLFTLHCGKVAEPWHYVKGRAFYFILNMTSKELFSNLKCYMKSSCFYHKSIFGVYI